MKISKQQGPSGGQQQVMFSQDQRATEAGEVMQLHRYQKQSTPKATDEQ